MDKKNERRADRIQKIPAVAKKKISGYTVWGYLSLLLFLVFGSGYWVQSQLPDGVARLYVLDVGQGDALLFRGRSGVNVLIDGGPDDSLLWRVSSNLPYFDRKIDLVMVTHPHGDHYTGFLDLLDRYEVGGVLLPAVVGGDSSYDIFLDKVREKGIPIKWARADEDFLLDRWSYLDILYPFTDQLERPKNYNNASIVARLNSCQSPIISFQGDFCRSVLLTGDAEAEVEQKLLENGVDVTADILKVAHHGSDTSSIQRFLEAVGMGEAVISVGEGNSYGHPSSGTLEKLEYLIGRENVHRTDQEGTVEFEM